MSKLLTISPSPHERTSDSVNKIMCNVIIALLPALIWSVYLFGWDAIRVTLISVISCVGFEYLIQRFVMKKEPEIKDLSAALTGLLLAFNLPSGIPAWMVVIGGLVAIGVAKMSFGGLGNNPFNPALVGRVFLLISFPVHMTTWPAVDATTSATPLAIMKANGMSASMSSLGENILSQGFIGNISGSMGEVSAILLLLGFVWMLYKKVITWHIPVVLLATVFVFQTILFVATGSGVFADALSFGAVHLLTGGVMLGAIFMATDMVTSPMAVKGQVIFAVGIAVITVLVRNYGAYPEGISFAILIMNAFTPLINTYVKPKRFGGK
ncbi:MAG: RnfABCDGE type electron transport complex subunit D [Mangrovibacterium sp.]